MHIKVWEVLGKISDFLPYFLTTHSKKHFSPVPEHTERENKSSCNNIDPLCDTVWYFLFHLSEWVVGTNKPILSYTNRSQPSVLETYLKPSCPPWHEWHWEASDCMLLDASLSPEECWATSQLPPTGCQWQPPLSCSDQKCLQTWPNVSLRGVGKGITPVWEPPIWTNQKRSWCAARAGSPCFLYVRCPPAAATTYTVNML